MSRLLKKYKEEIVTKLMKELELKNVMCVPRLKKIVLNRGVGVALENRKLLDEAMDELALISGQKPVKTKAKKSVANFKIREGNHIGCKVTLRGKRMYEFLDRFMNVALPRIRDFKGLSDKSFDGRGNYSIGIKEQVVFPEIDYNRISRISGLDVTLNTSATNDAQAKLLLSSFGMPFAKK